MCEFINYTNSMHHVWYMVNNHPINPMKRIIVFFILFISLSLLSVEAAQNRTGAGGNGSGSGKEAGQQNQQQIVVPATTTGNQIRNQNQVQTENQGTDQRLQIQTQEQAQTKATQGGMMGVQNRSQNANENMSAVAEKVQDLLQIRESSGIGEQIKQIAQEQSGAQDVIEHNTEKIRSRGVFQKFLIGSDYGAIKALKAQLELNQLRIAQLEDLKMQLIGTEDGITVQSTIDVLVQQNDSLYEQIESEEKVKSMFGWMFRYFAK